MTDFDQGILKPWLDEYEKFATSIKSGDAVSSIAREMLGIIAAARDSLHPSADSTANFVQNKEIIQQLAVLREQAETLAKTNKQR